MTVLGDIVTIDALKMNFEDAIGKSFILSLDNSKKVPADYATITAQDAAIEGVMTTIIAKNIFVTKSGENLATKVNARLVTSSAQDVMDVG